MDFLVAVLDLVPNVAEKRELRIISRPRATPGIRGSRENVAWEKLEAAGYARGAVARRRLRLEHQSGGGCSLRLGAMELSCCVFSSQNDWVFSGHNDDEVCSDAPMRR